MKKKKNQCEHSKKRLVDTLKKNLWEKSTHNGQRSLSTHLQRKLNIQAVFHLKKATLVKEKALIPLHLRSLCCTLHNIHSGSADGFLSRQGQECPAHQSCASSTLKSLQLFHYLIRLHFKVNPPPQFLCESYSRI